MVVRPLALLANRDHTGRTTRPSRHAATRSPSQIPTRRKYDPEQARYFAQRFEAVVSNVERFIQGKDDVVRLALVALLAGDTALRRTYQAGKTSLAALCPRRWD